MRLLNTLTVFSLAMIVAVLASVRRAHIRVEYSVSWLVTALALLGLSRSAGTLRWIGDALGVDDPASALLIVSGSILLWSFTAYRCASRD